VRKIKEKPGEFPHESDSEQASPEFSIVFSREAVEAILAAKKAEPKRTLAAMRLTRRQLCEAANRGLTTDGRTRTIGLLKTEGKTMSEASENVFVAAREISDGFFSKASESTPRFADGILGLRGEYLRAWAEGVGTWLELSEGFFRALNVTPKVSSDVKQMTRDAAETWIKAEEEIITGGLDASRQLVRAAAAGVKVLNTAGFRLADVAVSAVRARSASVAKEPVAKSKAPTAKKRGGAKH